MSPRHVGRVTARTSKGGGSKPLRRVDTVLETGGSCPGIKSVEEAVHLKIGELADVCDRAGELGHAVVDPAEPSDDAYSPGGERVQIDRRPLRGADQLGRRDMARPDDVVDLA